MKWHLNNQKSTRPSVSRGPSYQNPNLSFFWLRSPLVLCGLLDLGMSSLIPFQSLHQDLDVLEKALDERDAVRPAVRFNHLLQQKTHMIPWSHHFIILNPWKTLRGIGRQNLKTKFLVIAFEAMFCQVALQEEEKEKAESFTNVCSEPVNRTGLKCVQT